MQTFRIAIVFVLGGVLCVRAARKSAPQAANERGSVAEGLLT